MLDPVLELRDGPTNDIGQFFSGALDLLVATVSFSHARRGHLLSVEDGKYAFQLSAEVNGGSITVTQTPPVNINRFCQKFIEQAIVSGSVIAGEGQGLCCENNPTRPSAESAVSFFCAPIKAYGQVIALLYLELNQSADSIDEHVSEGIQLFTLGLGRGLQFSGAMFKQPDSTTETFGSTETAIDNIMNGLNPNVLRGVAASIATEVNDLLSAVSAHASAGLRWLDHDDPKLDNAKHSFGKITSSIFRVGEIFSAYQSAAHFNSSSYTSFSLQEAVTEAIDLLHPQLEECGIVCQSRSTEKILVHAERSQFIQALINIMSVATDSLKDQKILHITSEAHGNSLTLAIGEDGEGICDNSADAIFDPIFITKRGAQGIKLAVARTIAQLQGGELDIKRTDRGEMIMILRVPTDAFN
ncbi:ATP-binding protein [Aliirhizobium cellulosilyticum]|uniref:Signal transduction histidine kinase n=1 Tax=Aliirhizobium cellulosilyticum TaxID=393664 RepID=A0A7W6TFA4_9HYPH|nr:HAMP domain-containing sensor histidine kinase [Rhizobium cellulosilyticum]MBB4349351.1 signal transduction histidine kinase [Rhizobium cellulosilyticum]MBB4412427.1 signal transduction histidine kinase [Rhizobium cellulosilyticum]MBB4447059.1 signal transduction histidine kinase [Rhizobium cellulosilyticum]